MLIYQNKYIKTIHYGEQQIKTVYVGNKMIYNVSDIVSDSNISYVMWSSYLKANLINIDGNLYKLNTDTLEITAVDFNHKVNFFRNGLNGLLICTDDGVYHWGISSLQPDDTPIYSGRWDDLVFGSLLGTFFLKGTDLYQDVSGEPVLFAQNVSFLNANGLYYISNGEIFSCDAESPLEGLPSDADWIYAFDVLFSFTDSSVSSYPGRLVSSNGNLIWYRGVSENGTVTKWVEVWRTSDGRDYSNAQLYSEVGKAALGGSGYLLVGKTLIKLFIDTDFSYTLSVEKQNCSVFDYPLIISDGTVTNLLDATTILPQGNCYIDVSGYQWGTFGKMYYYKILRTLDNRFFLYSSESETVQELSLPETE